MNVALCTQTLRVTQRVQARSRGGRWGWALNLQGPGEIKRREVVLDPVVGPEEITSREVELACDSWTFFASLLLNSGATDIVL